MLLNHAPRYLSNSHIGANAMKKEPTFDDLLDLPSLPVNDSPPLKPLEPLDETPCLKKGLLWQQRERLFSRWKERYFILTKDYLHCFKKSTGRLSEMGSFLFKIKLADVESVEWRERRDPCVVICLPREGRMLLKTSIGLTEWYHNIKDSMMKSKDRRRMLRQMTRDQSPRLIGQRLVEMVMSTPQSAMQSAYSDSSPDIYKLLEEPPPAVRMRERKSSPHLTHFQHARLSLLTDIDLSSLDVDRDLGICMETPTTSLTSTENSRNSSGRLKSGSHCGVDTSSVESGVFQSPALSRRHKRRSAAPDVIPEVSRKPAPVPYRDRSCSDVASLHRHGRLRTRPASAFVTNV